MNEPIAIITPCFNENQTVIRFLEQLEETLSHLPHNFTVVVVDDCSTDDTLELLLNFAFRAKNLSLHVLSLEFNLGHQGSDLPGTASRPNAHRRTVCVMDSDGEDDPHAIVELVTNDTADIVHVVRGKRSEGVLFQTAYYFYQVMFWMITRQHMNFGNYCMINRKVLNATLHTSFIHFAAYLSKLRSGALALPMIARNG